MGMKATWLQLERLCALQVCPAVLQWNQAGDTWHDRLAAEVPWSPGGADPSQSFSFYHWPLVRSLHALLAPAPCSSPRSPFLGRVFAGTGALWSPPPLPFF